MPPGSIGLSKSRVMAGLQCHKRLWWTAHEPEAPELLPDDLTQALFDDGARVGAAARTYVPGGVLIDLPYRAYAERLAATQEAMARGARVIYEAAFRADSVFVSVDILERTPAGLGIVEVKSTTRVKEQHLPDVALQAHVLGCTGLDVARLEIMHLNRACAHPDLRDLFVRREVTEAARSAREAMPRAVNEQRAMLAGPLPDVAIGEHCHAPYECPFMGLC